MKCQLVNVRQGALRNCMRLEIIAENIDDAAEISVLYSALELRIKQGSHAPLSSFLTQAEDKEMSHQPPQKDSLYGQENAQGH